MSLSPLSTATVQVFDSSHDGQLFCGKIVTLLMFGRLGKMLEKAGSEFSIMRLTNFQSPLDLG